MENILRSPTLFGQLKMPNHMVMAPMTRNRASDAGVREGIVVGEIQEVAPARVQERLAFLLDDGDMDDR